MSTQQTQNHQDEMNFAEVFRVLRRYKFSIITLIIIATLLAGVFAYFSPNIYSSSATIFVNEDNKNQNEDILLKQLSTLSKLNTNIVFVLNDIGSSIVPLEKQTRKFVDLTGTIGQKLTSFCNEVYEVKFGLERRLK